MIFEPDAIEQLDAIDTTVCIIGAGPAGITTALRLDASGISVSLLECGGYDFDQESQSLYEGSIVGQRYDSLESVRLRFFGGSSNHWNGKCGIFTPKALEGIPGEPDTHWPIGFDELAPFYEGAQEICELGPFRIYGAKPEELVGATSEAVLSQLRGELSYRVFQRSPPTRFGEVYRPQLSKSKNIRVYLGAAVVDLQSSKDGRHITRARVRSRSGRLVPISSKYYVLATGGLENVRILLLSNAQDPRGLGNRFDLVGRYFMEHLHVPGVASVITKLPKHRWESFGRHKVGSTHTTIDLSMTDDYFRDNERAISDFRLGWRGALDRSGQRSAKAILNALAALSPPEDLSAHLGNIARGRYSVADSVIKEVLEKGLFEDKIGPYHFELSASMELRPSFKSRAYLGDRFDRHGQRKLVLDWHIPRRSYEDLRETLMDMAKNLVAQRIGALQILLDSYEEFLERAGWQWHHMGTTRMSTDPRRGIVDRDCRVHGLDNLYIAGSSVFPSGGSINPTLTICALALRLADHVKRRAMEG